MLQLVAKTTPISSSNICLQQRQENAPVVMVGCQGGAVGGVRGALLGVGFGHTVGTVSLVMVFSCQQAHI